MEITKGHKVLAEDEDTEKLISHNLRGDILVYHSNGDLPLTSELLILLFRWLISTASGWLQISFWIQRPRACIYPKTQPCTINPRISATMMPKVSWGATMLRMSRDQTQLKTVRLDMNCLSQENPKESKRDDYNIIILDYGLPQLPSVNAMDPNIWDLRPGVSNRGTRQCQLHIRRILLLRNVWHGSNLRISKNRDSWPSFLRVSKRIKYIKHHKTS